MTVTVSNMSDWNLMGLPVTVGDNDQMSVYPSSIEGTLFSFEDSYVQESVLNPGTGYWLRFEESGETNITGSAINSLTIQMQDDWNLISGISTPVEYTDIVDPEGIVIPGTLFGFGESYEQESILEPGKAYWLRTTDSGEIHLGSNRGARVSEVHNPDNMNSITVRGMTLYFGVEVDETEKLQYSLPPRPPEGAFDVRFIGDTRITKEDTEIELISPFEELTINYNVIYNVDESMGWMITLDNGKNYFLEGNGSLTIPSAERIFLNREPVIPITYLLYQNFPNPFNPSTRIEFDLRHASQVRLTIYNVLGQEVRELVNERRSAGHYQESWDGTDASGIFLPSGFYFYRLNAGTFIAVRKMLLMR